MGFFDGLAPADADADRGGGEERGEGEELEGAGVGAGAGDRARAPLPAWSPDWQGPPSAWFLPAMVPDGREVGAGDGVRVLLAGTSVWPGALTLHLAVFSRSPRVAAPPRESAVLCGFGPVTRQHARRGHVPFGERFFLPYGGEHGPRVGLLLSDRRRVTNLDAVRPVDAEQPTDHLDSGEGTALQHDVGGQPLTLRQLQQLDGGYSGRLGLHLSALPPEGPLTLVVEWPEEGLRETRTALDAGMLRAAAARAVEVWPDLDPVPDEELQRGMVGWSEYEQGGPAGATDFGGPLAPFGPYPSPGPWEDNPVVGPAAAYAERHVLAGPGPFGGVASFAGLRSFDETTPFADHGSPDAYRHIPLDDHDPDPVRGPDEAHEPDDHEEARPGEPRADWQRFGSRSDWHDLDRVRARLDAGAPVDVPEGTPPEECPLHQAAEYGSAEVVAELAARATNLDVPDEWDHTPLWTAVLHGRAATAAVLLAAGADPVRPVMGGWSAGRLILASPFAPYAQHLVRSGRLEALTGAELARVEEARRLAEVFGEEAHLEGPGITFVGGLDADEAVRRLGARECEPPEDPFEPEPGQIGVVPVEGGCVLVQPDSFEITRAESLTPLSSSGASAYGVFFNAKSGPQGGFAHDGVYEHDDRVGLEPSTDDPPERVLLRYLYAQHDSAGELGYGCAMAGIRPTRAEAEEMLGSPRRWVEVPRWG
ncbi:ankyrin repeat domain-containing protein [Streptomyces sp. ODS28]|uniref:ankyrin repeat domain-containing protein n=1 Tax=Streptomyces sp. ODS28 TaxID=3136688 RepID=UPI0031E6DEA6